MPKPSAFEKFFAGVFQDELEEVRIPASAWSTPPAGEMEPSWDRKAAWLLWTARQSFEEPEEIYGRKPKPVLTDDGY